MAIISSYEYIKKLMKERGAAFIDGTIMSVSGVLVDVRISGSSRVVTGVPIADHIRATAGSRLVPGTPCSLGVWQAQPYVIAIMQGADDSTVYVPALTELQVPNLRVKAEPAGYKSTWWLSKTAGVHEYELWGNDTEDGENPNLLYRGEDKSWLEPYNTGYSWFAVRAIAIDGTQGPLSAWMTDAATPGIPQDVTITMLQTGYEVAWTAVADATGYIIERSTDDHVYTEEVESGKQPTITVPFKESPANGGLHSVRVAAIGITGDQGEWSAYASHTSVPPDPTVGTFGIVEQWPFTLSVEGWTWEQSGAGGDAGWTNGNGHPDNGCLYSTVEGNGNTIIWTSPALSVPLYAQSELKYWWATAINPGTLIVEIVTNVDTYQVDSFAFSGNPPWTEETIDLSAYAGEILLSIKFTWQTSGSNNVPALLDTIRVYGVDQSTCHVYTTYNHELRWTQDSPELVKAWNVYTDADGVAGGEVLFATVTEMFVEIPYDESNDEYFGVQAIQWNNRTSDIAFTGPWPDDVVVTISGGAIDRVRTFHIVTSEVGVSDDLDTINGSQPGDLLIIRPATGHTITVKDGTGNIELDGNEDVVLDDVEDFLLLTHYGGTWYSTVDRGGHIIQDEGVPLTQRPKLNFAGAGVTATDDAGNNATLVTIPAAATIDGHAIKDEGGAALAQRANLNFVGAGVVATDDEGNDATVVTVAGGGGGGGWPFTGKVLTTDSADADADYSTIALAIAGAGDGDTLLLSSETFSEASLALSKSLGVVGLARKQSIIQSTGSGSNWSVLTVSGASKVHQLFNLRLLHNNATANENTAALISSNAQSHETLIEHCDFDATGSGGGLICHGVRLNGSAGTKTYTFRNCHFKSNGVAGAYALDAIGSDTYTLVFEGCYFDGYVHLQNANIVAKFRSCHITGDLVLSNCSTVLLESTYIEGDLDALAGTVTSNASRAAGLALAGTLNGWIFLGSANSLYTFGGNIVQYGASLAIRGIGSNVPTLGTTTAAEKWGHIYLALAKDIYPDNDIRGLWNRSINYGYNPVEHFHQGADDIVWTGWAAYTGFVTPSMQNYALSPSSLAVGHTAIAKAFRYRAYNNARTLLAARVSAAYNGSVGVMVDDGVNNADGNGANNFFRIMIDSPFGSNWNYRVQYRTGGGAVTSTAYFSMPPAAFYGVAVIYGIGTLWTNYANYGYYLGEAPAGLIAGVGGQTWTPARIGLYFKNISATDDERVFFDWYHETTV